MPTKKRWPLINTHNCYHFVQLKRWRWWLSYAYIVYIIYLIKQWISPQVGQVTLLQVRDQLHKQIFKFELCSGVGWLLIRGVGGCVGGSKCTDLSELFSGQVKRVFFWAHSNLLRWGQLIYTWARWPGCSPPSITVQIFSNSRLAMIFKLD